VSAFTLLVELLKHTAAAGRETVLMQMHQRIFYHYVSGQEQA